MRSKRTSRRKSTKLKKSRNFADEYAHRIARGLAKGLSRSQARGHPKLREKSISRRGSRIVLTSDQLQQALKALRQEKSLTAAARSVQMSPERLKRAAAAKRAIVKKRGRWTVRLNLPRRMLIYSGGRAVVITVGTFEHASLLGRYMSAVGTFLKRNDRTLLEPFVGRSVTDIANTSHPFETNPNRLYRLAHAGGETFEQIYRIVV